jgi:hypothetical protein
MNKFSNSNTGGAPGSLNDQDNLNDDMTPPPLSSGK